MEGLLLGPRTFIKINMADGSTSYIGGTSPQQMDINARNLLEADKKMDDVNYILSKIDAASNHDEIEIAKMYAKCFKETGTLLRNSFGEDD